MNHKEQHKRLESQCESNFPTTVIVKMKCCVGYSIQISKPRDQMIVCPKCGKKSEFIWSRVGNHKIRWSND